VREVSLSESCQPADIRKRTSKKRAGLVVKSNHAWRQVLEAPSRSTASSKPTLPECQPAEAALYDSARFKPAVVQNRFYAETGYDREIRAFCRQHRIIYQCFWTLTANPQVLSHRTVRELASKHRRTPEQILFRYLTQNDIVPLTGTRSEAHMRQDLAIFEFELAELEREALDRLF
jgi:Aldo/keto reductase family